MVGRVLFAPQPITQCVPFRADEGNTAGRVLDGEFAEPLSGAERVFV